MAAVWTFISGFHSLLLGMAVTMREMCRRSVTVQYPDEKLTMPERWRGVLNLEVSKCIACGLCERACPAKVLTVLSEKGEDKKRRLVSMPWLSDACALCNMCVASCPTDALTFYTDYEFASFTREELQIDLAKAKITTAEGGER